MRPRVLGLLSIASQLLAAGIATRAASAQTQYYNLDGNRPTRVEDAEPEARYALSVDLAPFQFEHLDVGINRYRAEPRLSYGVLPFTEIELRAPFVRVDPPRGAGASTVSGLAGLSLGALHAFNLETPRVPAVALAGEWSLPVGTLAGPSVSYLIKGLATKTTRVARFHVNAGAGTYTVQAPRPGTAGGAGGDTTGGCGATIRLPGTGCDSLVVIPFDTPCELAPRQPSARGPEMRCVAAAPATIAPSSPPRTRGGRWFAGVGADRAFGLASTVVTADLFAERFIGLFSKTDWTAEMGARHQLTPALVLDAGVGWHFSGDLRSTMVRMGAAYEFATPPLIR